VPPAARATRRASRHDATYRRLLGVADAVAAIMALVIAVPLLGDDGLRLAALAGIPIAVLVS